MKKLSMLLVAALAVSFAATGQANKFDPTATAKKITASNADIQNAKKAARAATWLERATLYYQASEGPVLSLYRGMSGDQVKLLVGEPVSIEEGEVNGIAHTIWKYDTFDLYFLPGQTNLNYWVFTQPIVENGLETSYQAFLKAWELDPATVDKVIPGINRIIVAYKEKGDLAFTVNDYGEASQDFMRAYDISVAPPISSPDSASIFNAGYTALFNNEYERALPLLEKGAEYGFELDGEIYYMQFFAHYNLGNNDAAQAVLEEGIRRFPGNPKLVENLVYHYNNTGQDNTQLIPIIREALEKDPDNFIFHFGMGMIYDKLGDIDNAETAFKRASELNPDDFSSFYNLGMMYIRRAELMIPELNEIPFNEQERYDAKLAEMNDWYRKSIEPIENAYEIKPDDPDIIEALRNMYFRFRDDSPEMMEKYNRYNAVYEGTNE